MYILAQNAPELEHLKFKSFPVGGGGEVGGGGGRGHTHPLMCQLPIPKHLLMPLQSQNEQIQLFPHLHPQLMTSHFQPHAYYYVFGQLEPLNLSWGGGGRP